MVIRLFLEGYYDGLTAEDIDWLSIPHNRGPRMRCLTLRGGEFSPQMVRLNADRIHKAISENLTEAQWDQLIVLWPNTLEGLTLFLVNDNPSLPPTCPRGPENKVYFGIYAGFQLEVYWEETLIAVTIKPLDK